MRGLYEHYKGGIYSVKGESYIVRDDKKKEILLDEEKTYIKGNYGKHTETEEQIKVYRVKKGNLYVISELKREEEEKVVVYIDGDGFVWVRPFNMFNENVNVEGKEVPRFRYLG